MWRGRINFSTLANRSAGVCCGQWQTSSTRTQRSRKMYTLIRPRAIIISARVGPGTCTARPAPALQILLTCVRPSSGALCPRDVWGADHFGDLLCAILRLCALFISLGLSARSDLFPPLTFRDEACPITLARFTEGAVATFRSLHPCASVNHGTKFPPNPVRWPHSG